MSSFTEIIQNVTLGTRPDFAIEETERFTLHYSMLKGVVEKQEWFFNGKKVNNNSHYAVEEQSLVILRPTRKDSGQYAVLLKNPFSSVTTHVDVTVLCKINNLFFTTSILSGKCLFEPPCLYPILVL